MTRRIIAMGMVLAAVAAANLAVAQDLPEFREGDRTFALSGSGSSDNDFDTTVASIEFEYGVFFTDTVAGMLRQGIGFADTGDGSDWNGSTRLALDWFFPTEAAVPFLGANIGYLYGDTVEEQFIAGPEAGLRVFVNETTFVNAVIEYQFLFEDADEADETFDDGRFVYALGLGVRL